MFHSFKWMKTLSAKACKCITLIVLNIRNFIDEISIPTEAEPITPARTFVEQLNLPGDR